jgi:uncharacterized protein YbbK (DUF523 family)
MTTTARRPIGPRIRIGVSACLLGDQVRYDGGHKRDDFLTSVLGPLVEWVKVCPEVEIGMGIPREPIHLVQEDGRVRLRAIGSGIDHTDAMTAFADAKAAALAAENLSGYILKADSPSCGISQVKVLQSGGVSTRTGVGLFARALRARFPELPIEDEQRLSDPAIRDAFLERVFAYAQRRHPR